MPTHHQRLEDKLERERLALEWQNMTPEQRELCLKIRAEIWAPIRKEYHYLEDTSGL